MLLQRVACGDVTGVNESSRFNSETPASFLLPATAPGFD
jgi:hypothetical protein